MIEFDKKVGDYVRKIVMMHFYEALDEYASNAWEFEYKLPGFKGVVKDAPISFSYSLDYGDLLLIKGKIEAEKGDKCVNICLRDITMKCKLCTELGNGVRLIMGNNVLLEAEADGAKTSAEFVRMLQEHICGNDNYKDLYESIVEVYMPPKPMKKDNKRDDSATNQPIGYNSIFDKNIGDKSKIYGDSTVSHSAKKGGTRNICVEDVIVKGLQKCVQKDHSLIPISARVLLDVSKFGSQMKVEEHEFHATYCEQCDSYFMSEMVYEKMRNMGRPLCRVISEKAYKNQNKGGGDFDWNDESILKAYGYNVNKQEGLTETQRRKILSIIVENGIMTSYGCIEHLKFCIKMKEGKANMEDAISKWKSDIAFLRSNQIAAYSIRVKNIFRKEKI